MLQIEIPAVKERSSALASECFNVVRTDRRHRDSSMTAATL